MVSPPDSPTRPALSNTTNIHEEECLFSFFTHPSTGKRAPGGGIDDRDKKRVKLSDTEARPEEHTCSDSDSDVDMDDDRALRARIRKHTVFGMRDAAMLTTRSTVLRHTTLSTRPILQSFVSSDKADVYRCHSMDESSYNTIPYACAYSNAAKSGSTPLLAIATEKGTIHVVNTSTRRDWDCEPPRTILDPHANGIFDVKWSPSDALLATASGDHSVRISTLAPSVSSEDQVLHVLHGHAGTVKCVAWDPAYDGDVLCTGGRDGGICVWDLRVGERCTSTRRRTRSGAGEEAAEDGGLKPVMSIPGAHEDGKPSKARGRKSKVTPAAAMRSITSLVYLEGNPHTLISSGSYDGVLRQWDLRLPTSSKKAPKTKATPKPILTSADPTTLQGTRRARGITTLVPGTGPSAGHLFALGTDSRVHTFALPSLQPLSGYVHSEPDGVCADPFAYTHPRMQTNSFYVRAALSPCGQWLASGGTADGLVFLFDVRKSFVGRARGRSTEAVLLRGQTGEVGALDWAQGTLATCADDATVRVWRPNASVRRRCVQDSEEMLWQWCWAMDE
ncbi:WD40 repeat-like protein [Daedalea quercina L-15889]|uniref:WD40 repeat-like protein n=1 Tax=Daedalea quercina L-15889 TaxID=1314783 RepID=A0A165SYE5_9APHY|nr:WD40 repeat-like protein [Daedalea quercina L-15889]